MLGYGGVQLWQEPNADGGTATHMTRMLRFAASAALQVCPVAIAAVRIVSTVQQADEEARARSLAEEAIASLQSTFGKRDATEEETVVDLLEHVDDMLSKAQELETREEAQTAMTRRSAVPVDEVTFPLKGCCTDSRRYRFAFWMNLSLNLKVREHWIGAPVTGPDCDRCFEHTCSQVQKRLLGAVVHVTIVARIILSKRKPEQPQKPSCNPKVCIWGERIRIESVHRPQRKSCHEL